MGNHDRKTELVTEKVSENYQPRPGQMDTRYFWIAYPPHVMNYGHEEDRISRAWGSGKLRREALAEASKRINDGWVVS